MRHGRPLTRGLVIVAVGLAVVLPGGAAHAETVRQAQWHLRELKISQVHQISTGEGVVVGLVDTGVEADHPDLKGRVEIGPRFDSASPAKASADTDGHGTGLAGIIAGKGGGDNNVLGIAPQATVLSVQGAGDNRDTVANRAAIEWAVDNGAQVLNLSFAQNHPSEDLRKAVAYALAKDVVVVAGAGNLAAGQTEVGYPAAIPGVIAVSGTEKGGGFWGGSARGEQVALSAPGTGIITTASRASGNTTGFGSGVGTSDASAIVSGAAALIRAKYPDLKAPDVINRLLTTADDAGPDGRDPQYGYGRLDILKALTAKVSLVSANPLGTPGAEGGTSTAGTARGVPEEDLATRSGLSGSAIMGFVIIGLLPVLAIVALIWALAGNRRRKRAQLAMAGGYPNPPPGAHPQPPGGHPPQAGGHPQQQPGPYPPQPQQPAAYPQAPGPYPPGNDAHPQGGPPPGGYRPGPPSDPRNDGR